MGPLQSAVSGSSSHLASALKSAGSSGAAAVLQHLVQTLEQQGSTASTTAGARQQGLQKDGSTNLHLLVQEALLQQAPPLGARSGSAGLRPTTSNLTPLSRSIDTNKASNGLGCDLPSLGVAQPNGPAGLPSSCGSQAQARSGSLQAGPGLSAHTSLGGQASGALHSPGSSTHEAQRVQTVSGSDSERPLQQVEGYALSGTSGMGTARSAMPVRSLSTGSGHMSLEGTMPVWSLHMSAAGGSGLPHSQRLLIGRQPPLKPSLGLPLRSEALAPAHSSSIGIVGGRSADLDTAKSGGPASVLGTLLSSCQPPSFSYTSSRYTAASLAAQGLALLKHPPAAGGDPPSALSPALWLALLLLKYQAPRYVRQLLGTTPSSVGALPSHLPAQHPPPVGLLVESPEARRMSDVAPVSRAPPGTASNDSNSGRPCLVTIQQHAQDSPAAAQCLQTPVLPAHLVPNVEIPHEPVPSTNEGGCISTSSQSQAQLSTSATNSPRYSGAEGPPRGRALRHARHVRTNTSSSITSPFASFSQLPITVDMSTSDSAPATPCHLAKASNLSTPAAPEEQG
jgi:hypothetical protein